MIQEVDTAFQFFVQYCIENMLYLSGPKLCVEGSHDSLEYLFHCALLRVNL